MGFFGLLELPVELAEIVRSLSLLHIAPVAHKPDVFDADTKKAVECCLRVNAEAGGVVRDKTDAVGQWLGLLGMDVPLGDGVHVAYKKNNNCQEHRKSSVPEAGSPENYTDSFKLLRVGWFRFCHYNRVSIFMNVSIVIPVYNEAERLGACLEAIALQRVKPLEVIVVDNNSTDETVRVAKSFSFVRLLHEPRQGVVHARTRGFNAARGTIIGRIDADTLLPEDWVANVLDIFKDRTIAAVSGSAHYYDFPLHMIADRVDAYLRQRLAQQLGDRNYLWGANMAMRRSAWRAVKPLLCEAAAMHEDFDIGIHLQELGRFVAYEPTLNAGVSSRRVDCDFMDYFRYTMVSPLTYKQHGLSGRRHMYLILSVCWLTYLPGRLLYRGYDHETRTFSLSRALAVTDPRVDPTTNIV